MRMDSGRTGLFRAEMDRQIRQQGNKDFDYMLHRITLNCNLNMEIAQRSNIIKVQPSNFCSLVVLHFTLTLFSVNSASHKGFQSLKIPYIHRHIWYLRLIYFFVPRMLYCVEQLLYTTNWVSYCLFFKGNHFIRCSTLYTGKIYFPCLEITETLSIWHANMLVSLSKYV